MRTFEEIYNGLKEIPDQARFSYLELIKTWANEPGTWNGNGFQMMKLKEWIFEITGVRPGNCSGCLRDMLDNWVRWVNQYEKDHPEPETEEVEIKRRRKRIGE